MNIYCCCSYRERLGQNSGHSRRVLISRSKYVKVVMEDGVSFTTKVAAKQLRYIPIMLRMK
jgi:hypothetical protein